jgi:hypothetical protein
MAALGQTTFIFTRLSASITHPVALSVSVGRIGCFYANTEPVQSRKRMKEWVLYVMRCGVQLGYASGDLNSPSGALRSRTSPISATAQNIRRPRSPDFTAPTGCPRPLLSASARALALSLLRIVGSIIRSVTARVERGFADFAQIPYEDARHRELCEFLDEFEGCLDEPSTAIQRTSSTPEVVVEVAQKIHQQGRPPASAPWRASPGKAEPSPFQCG